MFNKRRALQKLCLFIALGLFIIATTIYCIDPFYQYHAPYFGIKTVLFDKESQVIGSVRNLTYDSVLLGSSEAENFNSCFLDEQYNCTTLKVIKGSGSITDLLYYLDKAHKANDIKHVFWCLDTFALALDTELSVCSQYSPKYLFTDTMLDDFPYLFNKDVLLEKAPLLIAYSMTDTYTNGNGYNWSEGKIFGAEASMSAYQPVSDLKVPESSENYLPLVRENLRLIREEIEAHPNISYTILIPPYSLLWWKTVWQEGSSEKYLVAIDELLPMLVSFDNVNVFFFAADKEITCNLDYYMDQIHYSPEISQLMLNSTVSGDYKVNKENVDSATICMRDTFQFMITDSHWSY